MNYIRFNAITKTLFALVLFFGLFSLILKAEGTKQWIPAGSGPNQQMSLALFNGDDGNCNLGTYAATSPFEKYHIRISETGFADEAIYIGMRNRNSWDIYFRVKDPNGNIVVPITKVPRLSGDAGYISSLTQAQRGPVPTYGSGGYTPISVTGLTVGGDYVIEFNLDNTALPNNGTCSGGGGRTVIDYFDVTVAKTGGQAPGVGNHTAIDGRLFAFNWSFRSLFQDKTGVDGNTADNFGEVDSRFFVYNPIDSSVYTVDWEGVRPGGWNIGFTNFGLIDSGNLFEDRKSQPYSVVGTSSVLGIFPVFFNDPDSIEYPSATVEPQVMGYYYNTCPTDNCIEIAVTKPGTLEVLLEENGSSDSQYDPGTTDRLIVFEAATGANCVPWDGMDGFGNEFSNPNVSVTINLNTGQVHMPVGDVEGNPNGFKVDVLRPTFISGAGAVYYDDTELGTPFENTDFDYVGCSTSTSCHTWAFPDGNQRYISSWWNAAEDRIFGVINTNAQCAFPVEWLDITAEVFDRDALVQWTLASETHNDHFEVERSEDGIIFTTIGEVDSRGNTQSVTQYEFLDFDVARLPVQRIFYRITQVDEDGTSSHSSVVELFLKNEETLSVLHFPNPATDQVNVLLHAFEYTEVSVKVLNGVGATVYQNAMITEPGTTYVELDVSTWAKGLYFLQVASEDNEVSRKIVVQ